MTQEQMAIAWSIEQLQGKSDQRVSWQTLAHVLGLDPSSTPLSHAISYLEGRGIVHVEHAREIAGTRETMVTVYAYIDDIPF